MFSAGPSYSKLKTNLRLSINRLKLLEKKKTELAQKARREIADYLKNGKEDRARIRVEHIIREDYLVEAMEVLEMYCDLLLARFGLIQQMKTLDDGLAEPISSIIWAAPRLQADCTELKVIADQLTAKYGKPYTHAVRENALRSVNDKLMQKLSVEAPPKILIERYLIEIAKSHNIDFEPDLDVMRQDEILAAEAIAADIPLIEFNHEKTHFGGGSGGGVPPAPGFISAPPPSNPYPVPPQVQPPPLPSMPPSQAYPNDCIGAGGFRMPMENTPSYETVMNEKPKMDKQSAAKPNPENSFPNLPSVPTDTLPKFDVLPPPPGSNSAEDLDFDDLAKRFEELKHRK